MLTPSLTNVTIAIAIAWWPWYTRLIRGQAASVAGRPYIEACRALGVSRLRILLRHVLPNSITPLIVQVSLDVGGVILTVSALSFLGLGAQDPVPDWGLMVAEGQTYFTTQWWLVTFPAWRSCSPRSRSTCSATGCATCSTRARLPVPVKLQIRDLRVLFGDRVAASVAALDLGAGEIVGLAGESGSGKSMTTLAVLGLAGTAGATVSGIDQAGRPN